jgi:LETM1 and EF-hand domain-containing protein 1, mitochondrial
VAKKPLPKQQPEKSAQSTSPSVLKESDEQLGIHKSGPTAIDKTEARENASLTELAAEKKDEEKSVAKKEESKSLTVGQKIKKELQHYWDGTKLLGTEVKISFKLALKMAAGYELSRRENRQVWQLMIRLDFSSMLTLFPSSNVRSKILGALFLSPFSS